MIFLIFISTALAGLPLLEGKPDGLIQQISMVHQECLKLTNLPSNYIQFIRKFQDPPTENVDDYLECIVTDLDIWEDGHGFDEELVGPILEGHGNRYEIMNSIRQCNERYKTSDKATWMRYSANCIMSGPFGGEFERLFGGIGCAVAGGCGNCCESTMRYANSHDVMEKMFLRGHGLD